ncbi:MAG: carbamoyl-phosphate synthase large subunit, partial [Myxococcales bacterium]|nr:carbamoyl-phosphate synthase large subunit [Myxococcales bacterium]
MAGLFSVRAPMQAVVISVRAEVGRTVAAGQTLLILEAMKMEHVVAAEQSGVVREVLVEADAMVAAGDSLVVLEEAEHSEAEVHEDAPASLEEVRPDLAEVRQRHAFGRDENRADAVAKRRKTGQRTARENVADLVDEGTLVEYGALVIAAQRRRRPIDELIRRTPADGMIAGIGRVNGEAFGATRTQCVVVSYDYTVLAGTQGTMNHLKKDRMFELAEERGLPVVLFSEGGGGRPGDTDHAIVSGLDCRAFQYFAALSGKVPLVGVNSGRCFAG